VTSELHCGDQIYGRVVRVRQDKRGLTVYIQSDRLRAYAAEDKAIDQAELLIGKPVRADIYNVVRNGKAVRRYVKAIEEFVERGFLKVVYELRAELVAKGLLVDAGAWLKELGESQ